MSKRFVVIGCFILSFVFSANAQHGMVGFANANTWLHEIYVDDYFYGADSIGRGVMRVDYIMDVVVDTLQDVSVSQKMTLEIGANVSRFCTTAYMSLDSLLRYESISRVALASVIHNNVKYAPAFYSMIFQNYPQRGKLTCTGRVCNTDLKYEEDLPDMNWILHDDMDTLLGYTVQKAVCTFRGRVYSVWFTKQLPVAVGPWKFSGLPGLILKAEDGRGHYKFTASGVYRISSSIEMPLYTYLKTSRKKYIEAVRLNMTDEYHASQLYLRDIEIRLHDGVVPEKKKMEFDFIEITGYE